MTERTRDQDITDLVDALPCAGLEKVIRGAGLIEIELAGEVDTFGGASGEQKARQFGTTGSIRAVKPQARRPNA